MSGLEIAGLVFGTLPVLVEGLKQYRKGVMTIRSMFKYSREFNALARRIRMEKTLLDNTLENLLRGCTDDETLEDLLENPKHDMWKDEELGKFLQRKLRRSYSSFKDTVKALQDAVNDFKDRLKLSDDSKVPFDDSASLVRLYKASKFGLMREDYKDVLGEINIENNNLGRLVVQTTALEPLRKSRNRPNYETARAQATAVHETLVNNLTRSCTTDHLASLYVGAEHQLPIECGIQKTRFRVMLHHDSEYTANSARWTMEGTEFRVWRTADEDGDTQMTAALDRQGASSASAPTPGPSVPDDVGEIDDLCVSISTLRDANCGQCLGYLQGGDANRHELYCPSDRLVPRDKMSAISLTQLISGGPDAAVLTPDKQRILAAALARALLRFYDTPWLSSHFGSNEVVLFRQKGEEAAICPFVSVPVGRNTCTSNVYFSRSKAIRNDALFALGILLIEVCFQKPFAQMITAEDLHSDGTRHVDTEWDAADRLMDMVYEHAGQSYGEVVQRCIKCDFGQRYNTLSDSAFRGTVYDAVVAPLDEAVKWCFGKFT